MKYRVHIEVESYDKEASGEYANHHYAFEKAELQNTVAIEQFIDAVKKNIANVINGNVL